MIFGKNFCSSILPVLQKPDTTHYKLNLQLQQQKKTEYSKSRLFCLLFFIQTNHCKAVQVFLIAEELHPPRLTGTLCNQ